jgi:hypothetical protein
MADSRRGRWPWAGAALWGCLLLAAGAASAQSGGEVEFTRGVGFAQAPGQNARILGKGLALKEGDRLTTSDNALAIVKLEDGTRMAIRPNSELVLQQYRFKENAPDNSMLMQLVRGGFRAVTGLITKNAPEAAKIQTHTATIGIRGTDFDARLCARDCGVESSRVAATARPNAVLASAKVVTVLGELYAVDASNERRRLVAGGPVYPGDLVETMRETTAVLAFRDNSRVTLGSKTQFRVDNFVYDEQNAGDGRFLVSLLRGSVRALTGLIGKANHRNVGFTTATATIGVRGSGGDLIVDESGLTVFSWLGSWVVTPNGMTALEALQEGQGLFISPSGVQLIHNQPTIEGDRPDLVNVPPKLFSGQPVDDSEEGLFVYVRDGHIELLTASQILHLGQGEAGFAGGDGDTRRPMTIPKFLDFDRLPLPTARNPEVAILLRDSGIPPNNTCQR